MSLQALHDSTLSTVEVGCVHMMHLEKMRHPDKQYTDATRVAGVAPLDVLIGAQSKDQRRSWPK